MATVLYVPINAAEKSAYRQERVTVHDQSFVLMITDTGFIVCITAASGDED